MEWLDPVYASGHWVPELVKIAGGIDELGRERGESVRISWDEIAAWAPEVLVIMPCGFNLEQTMKQVWSVFGYRSSPFFDLPAVRNNRVYAVDANSYFARPGPRVVEGAELLAQLIHPELFDPPHRVDVFPAHRCCSAQRLADRRQRLLQRKRRNGLHRQLPTAPWLLLR